MSSRGLGALYKMADTHICLCIKFCQTAFNSGVGALNAMLLHFAFFLGVLDNTKSGPHLALAGLSIPEPPLFSNRRNSFAAISKKINLFLFLVPEPQNFFPG